MERAAWLERRFGAEIEWLPFDLHPEYPPEGIRREQLEARYGPGLLARTRSMIEEAGLEYAPGPVVSNSMAALQLSEFAREQGSHGRVHPLLFRAYWAEGRDIGEREVLREVAAAGGLDPDEALRAVDEGRFTERIRASTRAALSVGADGVPAWLVAGRLLVPGAQPHEVFDRVMERLGLSPTGP